ncbi:MAG: N-acetyltransferase family protein [Solirubrobacteraceae bacterium]
MSEIRPMTPDEIPQIAELYRFVDNSDWRIPPAEVPPWLQRTLLRDPWADPEIPTLVHVEASGEITAFIASHVRRMRFDDRIIRLASGGPLIVHPKARNRAVGPRLWRRYLDGPQELTTTDGASDEMRQIFELIGGQMLHPSSMAWARVFRPLSFVASRALHYRPRTAASTARVWSALDHGAARAVPYFSAPSPRGTYTEALTPRLLLEHLPVVTRSLRLFPDYDEPYLEWLFAELHHNRTWGTPVSRLVRDHEDRVLGWFVYFLLAGAGCQVVAIANRDRRADAVLEALFADIAQHGGAAAQGRVEPRTLAALAQRGALFRFSARSLVHSPEPELLAALSAGQALLTRLEGDWWMST